MIGIANSLRVLIDFTIKNIVVKNVQDSVE
jgi:hypothetical protein